MKVQIKETQNPTIVKFEFPEFILQNQHLEFKNIDEAKNSPLAQKLFYLPFVKTVYISGNFIAVERFSIVEWKDVQEEVANQIEDRFGPTVLSIISRSMKISKKEDGNRSIRVNIDFHHYMTGTFKNHNVKAADVVANLEEGHSLPDDFRPRWVREKRMFIEGLEKLYCNYEGTDFQKVLIDRAKALINQLL